MDRLESEKRNVCVANELLAVWLFLLVRLDACFSKRTCIDVSSVYPLLVHPFAQILYNCSPWIGWSKNASTLRCFHVLLLVIFLFFLPLSLHSLVCFFYPLFRDPFCLLFLLRRTSLTTGSSWSVVATRADRWTVRWQRSDFGALKASKLLSGTKGIWRL